MIICWARFRIYREEKNRLARKLYSDVVVFYMISLGKPNALGAGESKILNHTFS